MRLKLTEGCKMKKIVMFICIGLILMFSLSGCASRPLSRGEKLSRLLNSDQILADEITQEIVDALDARDEGKLEDMYSGSAIEEKTELEKQIKGLMKFYKGKTISFEGDASSSTSYNNGGVSELELTGRYVLVTTEATYQIYYYNKPISKENLDEAGLSYLEVVECREGSTWNGSAFWQDMEADTGAYYSNAFKDEKADEMMEQVASALDKKSADALKGLFSETTVEENELKLNQQIQELITFYQGDSKKMEGTIDSDATFNKGVARKRDVIGFYLLTTSEATYQVRLEYCPLDTSEPKNKGLSKLEFVKCEDEKSADSSFPWEHVEDGAGIYFY